MDFWTMIVLIAAIGAISDIIKTKRNNDIKKGKRNDNEVSQIVTGLNKRIENLETIILEKERIRRFEVLK